MSLRNCKLQQYALYLASQSTMSMAYVNNEKSRQHAKGCTKLKQNSCSTKCQTIYTILYSRTLVKK